MNIQVPERCVGDAYEYRTTEINELRKEVELMENYTKWTPDITSRDLSLSTIDGPIFAPDISSKYGLDFDVVYDTASDGTQLILKHGMKRWCVRSTARYTLYETAKLNGSALGRMPVSLLSETLNNGLTVARGYSLMLERFGKVSALHSDANGGYRIMPISELLDITTNALNNRFGVPDFKYGFNRHDLTYCIWELPDKQSEIIDVYQKALSNAVSHNFAINFMPAVRFSSSDTATSSAALIPLFKLPSGTYFRLGEGVQVQHKRSVRQFTKDGIELFMDRSSELFAMFCECADIIKKMAETEIYNPVNCLVGICNKLRIPKKYADVSREEVERFTINNPICSMHDLYLSMAEIVGYASRTGATQNTILLLEENVAKVLSLDWKEFDIGGVVAWGGAA